MSKVEKVVLVDKNNYQIGTAPKASVHTSKTPLHRAFSLFLFNNKNELLIQQRAKNKTFPLIWSNSVCGHPGIGESFKSAAARRLNYELGIETNPKQIQIIIPEYIYRAEMDGIIEHEFCPVLVTFTNKQPNPNPNEVERTRWVPWRQFLKKAKTSPKNYSPWSVEEALLLSKNSKFKKLLKNHTHPEK